MQVEDSNLLGEFLSEQIAYSPDLKAMVILMVAKQSGNVAAVSGQTGIAIATIYAWLSAWNKAERDSKKKA